MKVGKLKQLGINKIIWKGNFRKNVLNDYGEMKLISENNG